MEQILLPTRIIKAVSVENGDELCKKKPLQVVLRDDKQWTDSLATTKCGYVILDFGKEMNGSIRIITGANEESTSKIWVRFGESLSETCSEIGKKGATNDHSPRDFETYISAFGDITVGNSGFRFVRIDFLSHKKIYIQNIWCVNKILSKKPIYRYQGKDERIKQIFDVAKRTVDLCAAGEYVWDGVKRDRLVWIGDLHPEMLALVSLYGRMEVVERSLDFVREQTPENMWMNGIASYSMWWIIIVADYYFLTGTRQFAEKQLGEIEKLVKRFDEYVDEDGQMRYEWMFVDWQTCDTVDAEAGVRAINVIALKKAIELLQDFGKDTALAKKVLNKLQGKVIQAQEQKQVIALKYFAEGSISEQEYQLLIKDGVQGMSTFMSYYILKAVASRNEALAVEMLKEYYGGMLDMGATAFFEDFDLNWTKNACPIDKFPTEDKQDLHGDFGAHCYKGFRHSLCHGWSSGIIKFIKELDC